MRPIGAVTVDGPSLGKPLEKVFLANRFSLYWLLTVFTQAVYWLLSSDFLPKDL